MQKQFRYVIRNKLLAVLSTTLIVVILSAASKVTADAETAAPLSICDLLSNISGYRNEMITVRGIYWYGLRQSCSQPLTTGNHLWPSAVNLVDTDFASRAYQSTLSFETDRKSWDDLEKLVIREAKLGRSEEIWTTITGKLIAPEAYIRSDGQVVGGYGESNVFPAELVVKAVIDTAVRRVPTYDYQKLLRRPGR